MTPATLSTTPYHRRTLRLAASSFDRLVAQKPNLTPEERTELLALADNLRAVARGEADLLLTARATLEPVSDPAYAFDPDGGLAR
jgi:hypothetical protein